MLRFTVFLAFLLISSRALYAQEERLEAGLLLGSTQFLGEMGNSEHEGRPFVSDLSWKGIGGSYGGFFRYQFKDWVALRANFNYGKISGADSVSKNFARNLRNLHFKSHIIELTAIGELQIYKVPGYRGFKNILKSASVNRRVSHLQPQLSLSAFAGIGLMHFNPKAYYNGKWYALQPLGTEGQGIYPGTKKYHRLQIAMPVGLQAFVTTNPNLYKLGLEIGWRFITTDYLDDISGKYADPNLILQYRGPLAAALSNRSFDYTDDPAMLANTAPGQKKGNPTNLDSYVFTNLSFTYTFRVKDQVAKYDRGSGN